MTLLDEFLSGQLDPSGFSHRDHVEVAWTLLSRFPFDQALREFESGVRVLSARAGAPEKYHATITQALVHIVHVDHGNRPCASWSDYVRSEPEVLGDARAILLRHFSEARLSSEQARNTWCEPDRVALPAVRAINNC